MTSFQRKLARNEEKHQRKLEEKRMLDEQKQRHERELADQERHVS